MQSETPYDGLSPDRILDALESAGFRPTGGLLALNSYENRVYQIELETDEFVVAKFYRPDRWTDPAILEEHTFTLEMFELELPVVPPLLRDGTTLFEHEKFRFAVFPRLIYREWLKTDKGVRKLRLAQRCVKESRHYPTRSQKTASVKRKEKNRCRLSVENEREWRGRGE